VQELVQERGLVQEPVQGLVQERGLVQHEVLREQELEQQQ
jgi:hypothetical protein